MSIGPWFYDITATPDALGLLCSLGGTLESRRMRDTVWVVPHCSCAERQPCYSLKAHT